MMVFLNNSKSISKSFVAKFDVQNEVISNVEHLSRCVRRLFAREQCVSQNWNKRNLPVRLLRVADARTTKVKSGWRSV